MAVLLESQDLIVIFSQQANITACNLATGVVCGEVFEVNDAMLQNLDNLEGHPMVFVMYPHDGNRWPECWGYRREDGVVDCQVYVMHNFKKSLMNLPHMSSYSSYSEEGKPIDLSVEDKLSDQLSDTQSFVQVKRTLISVDIACLLTF